MKRDRQKAMFASRWNHYKLSTREKMLEEAGIFVSHPKFTANKSFDNLAESEKDMLFKHEGISHNKTVKYPYKLKTSGEPRQPNEPEIHYLERTGQILSSRIWSKRKKHMVHFRTGNDYHE